jgi:ribosomal-protein-alanine N-acetyltransferase
VRNLIWLESERLILRDHVEADFESHHELISNEKNMYYMPEVLTHSLKESRENFNVTLNASKEEKRSKYFLRIETKDGIHVGEIGYSITSFTPLGNMGELGYFIREEMQKKGYASEAAKRLIEFAFKEGGLIRLYCSCLKENAPSEALMKKIGLIKEAELRDYEYHDGKLKTRVIYRLLKDEYAYET